MFFVFVLSFIIMNSGFGLIPADILDPVGIHNLWDLGLFIMFLSSIPFFLGDYKKVNIDSSYLKFFLVFLSVVIAATIWSITMFKYDLVDTLKSSRDYLGYFAFFLCLSMFIKDERYKKTLFIYLYYILFFLIIMYILQYVTDLEIFAGHRVDYEFQGKEISRNVPIIFSLFFIFLWYNLGAWLSGRKTLKGGKVFVILAYGATLLTLTRGIYIATFLCTLLVILYFLKRKEINLSKMTFLFFAALLMSLFLFADNPFSKRIGEISEGVSDTGSDSTFLFRLAILGERAQLAMEKSPAWGLGFYHPQNEADLGLIFGPWEEDRNSHALWSADIAWANIVYQMGLIGVISISLFFISFIAHFPRIIKHNRFLEDDLIGFAVYVELIRQMILMWIGASFTSNTQNVSLFLAFYTYWYQHGISIQDTQLINNETSLLKIVTR